MTFDPERWRASWLALITGLTSLILGTVIVVHELITGRDPEFALIGVGLIVGSAAPAVAEKVGRK